MRKLKRLFWLIAIGGSIISGCGSGKKIIVNNGIEYQAVVDSLQQQIVDCEEALKANEQD